MNYEEIIQVAVSRPEPVWHWGDRLRSPVEVEKRKAIESMARELGATLLWGEPIRPGDLYLAIRNRLSVIAGRAKAMGGDDRRFSERLRNGLKQLA